MTKLQYKQLSHMVRMSARLWMSGKHRRAIHYLANTAFRQFTIHLLIDKVVSDFLKDLQKNSPSFHFIQQHTQDVKRMP